MHYKTPIQLAGVNAHASVNMLIPNGEELINYSILNFCLTFVTDSSEYLNIGF